MSFYGNPQFAAPQFAAPQFAPAGPAAPQGYGSYGAPVATGPVQVGFENVVVRVPTRRRRKNVFVPGPVVTRTVQGPPREVVRSVKVQGPAQIQKVRVQAPGREIVRKVAVPGPAREVVRTVKVQLPAREIVKRVKVQGEPRVVVKHVQVQGPAREVIRKIHVQGPPTYEDVPVPVHVQGPPRDVVQPVPVAQPVLQQVVRPVPVPIEQDVPVPVPEAGREVVVGVRDNSVRIQNELLKKEVDYLRSVKRTSSRKSRKSGYPVQPGFGMAPMPMAGYPTFGATPYYGQGFNGYNTFA